MFQLLNFFLTLTENEVKLGCDASSRDWTGSLAHWLPANLPSPDLLCLGRRFCGRDLMPDSGMYWSLSLDGLTCGSTGHRGPNQVQTPPASSPTIPPVSILASLAAPYRIPLQVSDRVRQA